MKQKITTTLAPTPGGPFSQAIRVGNRVYVAGQTPIDPKTGTMPESFEEQTRQVMRNIEQVLEAAGAKLSDVVKVTTYLTDLDNFDTYNKVYREFFQEPLPARSTIGCQLKGIPLEIDAIAEIEPA